MKSDISFESNEILWLILLLQGFFWIYNFEHNNNFTCWFKYIRIEGMSDLLLISPDIRTWELLTNLFISWYRWNCTLPSSQKLLERIPLLRISWELLRQERRHSTLFSGMKTWDNGWIIGLITVLNARLFPSAIVFQVIPNSCNILWI